MTILEQRVKVHNSWFNSETAARHNSYYWYAKNSAACLQTLPLPAAALTDASRLCIDSMTVFD
jgi:hypothetical protein